MPQTIIENWLYTWISKWEGEVPGTWILKQTQKYPDEMIWNSVSANRVLWSSISTCARRTPSGVTSVDGGHRGRFTKDEFDMFLGIWRPRSWDKGSQTKGKFQGVVSTLFGGGFGSWRSQLTIFPSPSPCVPIAWRLQVERFFFPGYSSLEPNFMKVGEQSLLVSSLAFISPKVYISFPALTYQCHHDAYIFVKLLSVGRANMPL